MPAGAPALTILVADDDEAHRKLMIAALRHALGGIYTPRFVQCENGPEVLARLEEGGIDIVMLDYMLPEMNGLAVLSELQLRQSVVPVVLVTSSNDREVMLEAMRRGATDFLTKDEMGRARLAHVVRSSLEVARLRADCLRTQKLAAIGILAGGVAHEFNNILQVVLGHSQYALGREDPERWKKALRHCQDSADKGARIVRQLLTFARKSATSHMRFRLDRAVAEAVQLDEEAARRDGVKVTLTANARPTVMGDSGQIVQVMLNLLTNARHACTTMLTSREQLMPRIDITIEADGKFARVSVRDNGVGIAPDVMPRLFEPFFTTKGSLGGRVYDGKHSGTGLGLAISSSIVEGHQGRIDVSSKPGSGSTFSLRLPLAPSQGTRTPKSGINNACRETVVFDKALKGRRVLIVDDEALIGDLLAGYLGEKGLCCDLASSVDQAREMLGAHDFDLLLFDLALPGECGGLELLLECRAGGGPNAAAPALAMTGHATNPEDEKLFDAGFRGVVRKPFEMREIGRMIADSMRAPANLIL